MKDNTDMQSISELIASISEAINSIEEKHPNVLNGEFDYFKTYISKNMKPIKE